MKFSSVIKVENQKVIPTLKTEYCESIESSLVKSIPIIINGICLQTEIEQLFPKLENAIWIESSLQFKKLASAPEYDNSYIMISSYEFSNYLLSDIKLSNYETLIINNFHYKDPYIDLVVSNIKYIQNQRRSSNLSTLKIIVCTYPLPLDCLTRLFDNSMIFNLETDYCENLVNLESDICQDNYLENLFKTIYLLFTNKLGEFNSTINTTNLMVLVFLADSTDSKTSYKWLNSRLVSMINAYIVLADSHVSKKTLASYSSLLVLSPSSDKNVLHSLNIEFDYVIDCGLITTRKLNRVSNVDCMGLEKIDLVESLIRSHYVAKSNGKVIQLYDTDKLLSISHGDFTNYLKIKHDITDYLFCQIALGTEILASFASIFTYLPWVLKCGIENLVKAKIVAQVNPAIPMDKVQRSRVVMTIMNYELTELGRKCLKVRQLDCRSACVLINALTNECLVPCLTLVCLLQVSDALFVNLYGDESAHVTKLRNIYEGNDDLQFLLKLFRFYVNLSKEARVTFQKSSSLNKICLTNACKLRTSIKESFPFEYNNATNSENITKSFVAAYPFQIAKYSQTEKLYVRPGCPKANLSIDPYSFAHNEEDPIPFVFYFSAYTENNNTYMKYVSPITREIWDEFSAL